MIPLSEGYFTHEGYRTFFVEGGEGDAMVFLHPLGGSIEFWKGNLSKFAQSHHVIAFDFLGCGRSDRPDIPYGLASFVDRLIALLNDRKIERATLLGNSLGGHVAMLAAVTNPARVAKLVLSNPSGLHAFPRPAISGGIQITTRALWYLSVTPPEAFMRGMLHRLYGAPGAYARELAHYYAQQMKGDGGAAWKRAFVRTLESIFSTPLDEVLPEIDRATLIIWGQKDHLLGRHGGEAMARLIPQSRLERFENSGHFPQYEDSERYNSVVEAFVKRV